MKTICVTLYGSGDNSWPFFKVASGGFLMLAVLKLSGWLFLLSDPTLLGRVPIVSATASVVF